jgi:hypothetical protein
MYILFTTALPNPCTYLGTKNAQERLGKSDKSEISEIGNFKSLYHHKIVKKHANMLNHLYWNSGKFSNAYSNENG